MELLSLVKYWCFRAFIISEQRKLRADSERMGMLGIGRQVTGYGVSTVVLSNDVILMSGFDKDTPGALASANGFIYVNDAFLTLPGVIQHALIQHELGHHELGHTGLGEAVLLRLMNERFKTGSTAAIQLEYEADEYSLTKGSDMINALTTMRDLLDYRINGVVKNEVALRIQHLQQLEQPGDLTA